MALVLLRAAAEGKEHEEKPLAFFQPVSEEQVQLEERMVRALPEHENGAARNGGY